MASAKEISMALAVAAVVPQEDFARKIPRTTARARLVEKMFFDELRHFYCVFFLQSHIFISHMPYLMPLVYISSVYVVKIINISTHLHENMCPNF